MKRRVTKRHWPGKPGSLGHKPSGAKIAGSLPWRVLVIEGDPRERELLMSYLRAAGYVVQSAETGTLALSLAVSQPLDLILLDLRLPDMEGYEVCRLLRQKSQTQTIPVIIITDSEELTLHRQAYAEGAQACIPKPVREPALVATIEAVLAGARRKKTTSAAGNQGAGQPKPMSGVRRFQRFSVSLAAIGWTAQFPGEVIEGVVRNISPGGFMVEFSVQMVPGSTVDLVLETQRGPLEVKGRVVWTSVIGDLVHHGCVFPVPKGPDFASNM